VVLTARNYGVWPRRSQVTLRPGTVLGKECCKLLLSFHAFGPHLPCKLPQ
jgi:hypothetical protein